MPPAPKPTDNLDKIRHMMGTRPDSEIADIAGSTISVVGRYRRKHGIAAYDGYKFGVGQSPPPRKGDDSAGDKPTTKKGRGRVYSSRLDPFRDIVGKLPDRVVAQKAGMSTEGVRMYRRRHKIPLTIESTGAAAPARTIGTRRPRPSKLDPFRDLLGTVPDREVAAMAGVTSENVRAYRRKRGIPAGWRGEGRIVVPPADAAAPAATPGARPARVAARRPVATSGQAYEIAVRGVDGASANYIVVASSLAEAAAVAHDAIERTRKGGTISMIKHLGPALT